MYESKMTPGKKFGNGFQGKKYDEMHAPGKMESAINESKESPEFESGEQEGAKEGAGEMHPVVAEHGKATEVHTMHDHANKKHHVHTKHEDGHENHSDHETPEEAHEEGGKLAGVKVTQEHPDKPQLGAESEEDNFEMPPLV